VEVWGEIKNQRRQQPGGAGTAWHPKTNHRFILVKKTMIAKTRRA
jgi:hypothetical protein